MPRKSAAGKMVRTRYPGIYKRGDKYVATWRDARGRQCKAAFETATAARAHKSEMDDNRRNGRISASKASESFETYARAWVKNYRGVTQRGLRESTREDYEQDLELYAIPFFGALPMGDVKPADIDKFLHWMLDEPGPRDNPKLPRIKRAALGVSPGTARNAYAPVRVMFGQAHRLGHINNGNPCAGMRMPASGRREEPRPFSDSEWKAVIEKAPARWQLMLRFMHATGVRISEAVGVKVSDINWERNHVRIRRSVVEGVVDETKSFAGQRTIPISNALMDEISEWCEELTDQGEEAWLWQTLRGQRVDPRNLYRQYKPVLIEAGCEWAGFHTTRHTAATRWILSGMDILTVAKLLGHAQASTTLNIYGHLIEEHLPSGEDLA